MNADEPDEIVWIRQDQLPPLTDDDLASLRRLAEDNRPIDFSDIPPLDDDFFKRARPLAEVREERRKGREERIRAAKAAAE